MDRTHRNFFLSVDRTLRDFFFEWTARIEIFFLSGPHAWKLFYVSGPHASEFFFSTPTPDAHPPWRPGCALHGNRKCSCESRPSCRALFARGPRERVSPHVPRARPDKEVWPRLIDWHAAAGPTFHRRAEPVRGLLRRVQGIPCHLADDELRTQPCKKLGRPWACR